MQYETKKYTITQIATLASTQKLNPDPIGQRPPVDSGWGTSQGIIDSIITGFSIGELTLRDIRGDDAQEVYGSGTDFLVIDGGHRIRAIRDYIAGRFAWGKMKYSELDEAVRQAFDNIQINVTEYKCTAPEATEIFRRLNISTPVNEMERIMANDQSEVARQIRTRTRFYREYKNDPHPLFEVVARNQAPEKPTRWESKVINERRVWDRWVAIALLKSEAKGHIDAGYPAISKRVDEDDEISKKTLEILDKFLDDVCLVSTSCNRQFNPRMYSLFMHTWFEMLSRDPKFKIDNHKQFGQKFFKALAHLVGVKSDKYEDVKREFQIDLNKRERIEVKQFAKNAATNFANIYQQREVANLFLEEMGDLFDCVTIREVKRSETKYNIQDMLALQDYKCEIDGLPLDIENAIFGHDLSWGKGGNHDDARVVRKIHNQDMGATTIDQYRRILIENGYPVSPELS